MRAVIQRVQRAQLRVSGELISSIGTGLVVYLGIGKGDDQAKCEVFARKLAALRIFEDESGRMNKSILAVSGEVLLVSQFTLYGDCSHGNRPSFSGAELAGRASELYSLTASLLEDEGVRVSLGVFGADMKIEQLCDGPVTITYEL